jgi:hypothetical protein
MAATKPEQREPYITFAGIFDEEDVSFGVSQDELETMSALPDILPPTQPPAFAKERVMSNLQEPMVEIFVPPAKPDQKRPV